MPALLLWLNDEPQQRELDDFRQTWRSWLRAGNIFQFALFFCALTATACRDGLFDDFAPVAPGTPAADIQAGQQAWQACLELVSDDRFHSLLDELMRAGCPIPEAGYEITDGARVLGEAELAWPDRQIGIVTEAYASLVTAAAPLGWTLWPVETLDTSLLQQKLG